MESSLNSYFQRSNSILIVLPKKPYFDQVAAGLSLYLSLLGKKQVSIICPSPMLVEFNRLVGVDKVAQQPEEKNLVIHFAGYDATSIEKVSSDVKDGELYLTLVPVFGVKPPTKDQIRLFYDGSSFDLMILIGGADESHFPILSDSGVSSVDKIHIGLRELRQTKDNNIVSYVRNSSSVSELVADLIRELELEVDQDTASNLIAGIEVGSDHFSSEGTTANTFQTIADLLRLGGKRLATSFKAVSFSKHFEKHSISRIEEKKSDEKSSSTEALEAADQNMVNEENPPSDWLAPKIFKGTSIS